MAESDTSETQAAAAPEPPIPSLDELQHWTWVMGRAQQLMMEHLAEQLGEAASKVGADPAKFAAAWPMVNWFADPAKMAQAQVDLWSEGLSIWQRALGGMAAGPDARGEGRQGQALRRAGMARQSAVRHDPPDLSADLRPAARLGRRDRGRRREDAREDAVHDPGVRRRDVAVQLRADQPAGDRAGDRDQGREPAQGPRAYARGPRARASSPIPTRARSRSAATSRSRRARWSSRRRSTS